MTITGNAFKKDSSKIPMLKKSFSSLSLVPLLLTSVLLVSPVLAHHDHGNEITVEEKELISSESKWFEFWKRAR